MSDPSFEDQLRALRPGKLPSALAARLMVPPARRTARRIVRVCFAAAAAACVALLLRPAEMETKTPGTPLVVNTHTSRVTGVRPLSLFTDQQQRPWRLVEVNWVEERTLVSAAHPAAVQLQDRYCAVVPVPVRLD